MSDDILFRLQLLEGTMSNSTAVCKLLREAAAEIERLRALLGGRKRGPKRGDDDGAPEVIPTGPPKTPPGGSPAFATRLEEDELSPSRRSTTQRAR